MSMKKLHDTLSRLFVLSLATLLFVGCSNDSDNNDGENNEPLSQAELKSILSSEEISGSVDQVLAEILASEDTTAKVSSECYEATHTEAGFTATFNNCVLNGTDQVNGTLTVVYATGSQEAAFTATFTDFFVGTIKVNGSRTYVIQAGEEENSVAFSVTSDMELILEDESIIAEAGTKSVVLTFGEALDDISLAVTGEWMVEMDGNTYVLEVLEDLVGTSTCEELVSGQLYVAKNGLAVTVDFGDGTCDNLATLIYPDDTTEDVTLDD